MRESMKLEYDILKQHESLRKSFCKSKQYLIQCMELLGQDSELITYESLLLMSIFLLAPVKDEEIKTILQRNGTKLIDFIDEFSPKGRPEEELDEFNALKDNIIGTLR